MNIHNINITVLLEWFSSNKRDLPWRKTKDPYKIWVSEIMLQQTQVQTVIPYYYRFLERFPTLHSFVNAPDDEVMKAWEGLGYYSRVRNMQAAARTIIADHRGEFPDNQEGLLKLKGFGPYTSASVASLAFGQQVVAVDGNVKRVISRLFAIRADISKPQTFKEITACARSLCVKHPAGVFNEAMMELGAVICTPKSPDCNACPLSNDCRAFQRRLIDQIPFKPKKAPVPHYTIAVGVVTNSKGDLLIALRPKDGLLGNLWEFPGGKQTPDETLEECCKRELREELGIDVSPTRPLTPVKHAYSHFKITLHAFICTLESGTPEPKASQAIKWVAPRDLNRYAFPKANKALLKDIQSYFRSP